MNSTDISVRSEEEDRPSSAQSAGSVVSVPAISLIGRHRHRTRSKYYTRKIFGHFLKISALLQDLYRGSPSPQPG